MWSVPEVEGRRSLPRHMVCMRWLMPDCEREVILEAGERSVARQRWRACRCGSQWENSTSWLFFFPLFLLFLFLGRLVVCFLFWTWSTSLYEKWNTIFNTGPLSIDIVTCVFNEWFTSTHKQYSQVHLHMPQSISSNGLTIIESCGKLQGWQHPKHLVQEDREWINPVVYEGSR